MTFYPRKFKGSQGCQCPVWPAENPGEMCSCQFYEVDMEVPSSALPRMTFYQKLFRVVRGPLNTKDGIAW